MLAVAKDFLSTKMTGYHFPSVKHDADIFNAGYFSSLCDDQFVW